MEGLDPVLLSIRRRGTFLHERIAGSGVASRRAASFDVTSRDRRLKRWSAVLGGKGTAALEERIAAAGWPMDTVAAILGDEDGGTGSASHDFEVIPAWLLLIQRVIAAASKMMMAGDPSLPFGELVMPFIEVGDKLLEERVPAITRTLGGRARADIRHALAKSVSDILAPCFLADLEADRPAAPALLQAFVGSKLPAVSDEHYHAFVEHQRNDGLRGFLLRYPVAARLVATRVEAWVDSWTEFADRLVEDQHGIAGLLGIEQDGGLPPVQTIRAALSDPHDNGRSVAMLTFEGGGRVVYKPRSLAAEIAWRDFVITVSPSFANLAARAIDRGSHGWMEYLAPQEAASREEIRAFYRSAGALLCLARAFGLKDLHFENIVAAGAAAVPIDLETILQPRFHPWPATILDRITLDREAVLDGSVRDTEALPVRYSLSDQASRDISAFADFRMATQRRRRWQGLRTDAITQVFVEEPFEASNLPQLDGEVFPPADFVDEIIAGFETTWKLIEAARETFEMPGGWFDRIDAVPVRVVLRATEIYYRLLERALDPSKLRDGIDFSIEIEALHQAAREAGLPAAFRDVIAAEVAALHRGDIPRFTIEAGGAVLLAESSPVMDDAVATTGTAEARKRLSRLGRAQLAAECRYIRASFDAAQNGKPKREAAPIRLCHSPVTADRALEAAMVIGETILKTRIARADGGSAWIGIAYRDVAAGPAAIIVNESFYEGTTGIAVFLAALHRATGEKRWADAAMQALADARRLVSETPARERAEAVRRLGLGIGGLGGMIYGLVLTSDMLGCASLREDADRLASWIDAEAIAGATAACDLIGGAAGALPGLEALANPAALTCADRIMIELAASTGSGHLIDGYGHGTAGAAATLALLVERHPQIRDTVLRAVKESSGSIAQARPTCPPGWCKGPVGQALARLVTADRLGLDPAKAILGVEHAAGMALGDAKALDQICCGLFGVVDALLTAGGIGAQPDLTAKAGRLARALLDRADLEGGFRLLAGMPPSFENPGFFQGISGIGYTLLRFAKPHRFPSILVTEWRS